MRERKKAAAVLDLGGLAATRTREAGSGLVVVVGCPRKGNWVDLGRVRRVEGGGEAGLAERRRREMEARNGSGDGGGGGAEREENPDGGGPLDE